MHSKRVSLEWVFWSAAVLLLAATDPHRPPLVDLCMWKYVGYASCPGCGLGHALAYLLNGDFLSAIDAHPLSPFAAGVILLRIKTLWPRRSESSPKNGSS
ncbi:MAG: DUF2752 domain-containing protein [Rhodothermia bacterium]|nr:DUF2752 domain-containing protein [Rhodothermia bacterium]